MDQLTDNTIVILTLTLFFLIISVCLLGMYALINNMGCDEDEDI